MKKKILFQAATILIGIVSYAQNTNCNRSVWIKEDEKKTPKEVCIPKGYLISNIYESTDINGDSLIDFIFKWRRPELQDGDTMFVTIYIQNPDSTFSYFRTFNNLYPIYFKSYSRDYVPKNKSLIGLHKKYYDFDPLIELSIKKDVIQITRKGDAMTYLIITYRYDKDLKNWRYEMVEMYDRIDETKTPYNDLSDKLGPTIDNFTYFIWEEDE